MPAKKKEVEQAVKRAMPGWKIVKRSPAADHKAAASARPDSVSPGLAAQQVKVSGARRAGPKRAPGKKKSTGHAQFVVVTPESQPDSVRKFQKVVVVKNGKIVAQQG
jgi:hypothetical protein